MPAATAAADPPEEPPGTQRTSCGFRVGPNALFSVDEPIANSSMFVLATINAPLARSLFTAVASNGLLYPARILEAQVVGSPSDAMLSLIATGTPASTPMSVAAPTRCLSSSASARLAFSSECRKMLSASAPAPSSAARANEDLTMSEGDDIQLRTLEAIACG